MVSNTRRRALGLLLAAGAALRFPVCRAPWPPRRRTASSPRRSARGRRKPPTRKPARASTRCSFIDADLRPARRDPGRRELRGQDRGLWRSRHDAAAEEIPDQAGEPADRARRGRQGGRRRAALRQLHRHFRRQGEHRAAARHRAALPRRQVLSRSPSSSSTRTSAASSSTARRLRAGLAWASERKEALAALAADEKCEPPEGCFITTACCETLGLDDDCFELRTLRRYRDEVLAKRPGGSGEIAAYYQLAPLILARLPHETRDAAPPLHLCALHPASALAARLGLNALAYRLYVRMLDELAGDVAPTTERARELIPRPCRSTCKRMAGVAPGHPCACVP